MKHCKAGFMLVINFPVNNTVGKHALSVGLTSQRSMLKLMDMLATIALV